MAVLDPFFSIFWIINFLNKLCYLHLQLPNVMQKRQKKLLRRYREKLLTDRQTDRRTGDGNFTGKTVVKTTK